MVIFTTHNSKKVLKLRVAKFGATLVDWKVDDNSIIFVSPNAVFDGKKAIR